MPQNIYDDPDFYEAYQKLRAQGAESFMAGSMSEEELRKALPSLQGAAVLDIGCGDGWFSRWAIEKGGAASTHGLDLSQAQVALARELTEKWNSHEIRQQCAQTAPSAPFRVPTFAAVDLNVVSLPTAAHDVVFSWLALHYVSDLGRVMREVYGTLRPGGTFFFGVEHPLYTSPVHKREVCCGESVAKNEQVGRPSSPNDPNMPSKTSEEGSENLGEGGKGNARTSFPHWPVTRYLDAGPRRHYWLGHHVEKQHWPTQAYVNMLLDAGLSLVYFRELAKPGDGSFGGKKWWMTAEIGPSFLVLGGEKREKRTQQCKI